MVLRAAEKRALLSIVDTIDFLKQQRTQFSCQEMIQSSRGKIPIFNIYNYNYTHTHGIFLIACYKLFIVYVINIVKEKILNEKSSLKRMCVQFVYSLTALNT